MRKAIPKILMWGSLIYLLLPGMVLAAGPRAADLVIVADTRKLGTWQAWWANLYNESHFYFTLVAVLIIPLVGFIFGILADLVMGSIGIDLKSRELAEH